MKRYHDCIESSQMLRRRWLRMNDNETATPSDGHPQLSDVRAMHEEHAEAVMQDLAADQLTAIGHL